MPMTAAALVPGAERVAQVIIVGAGPAGAATAYHLANAGIDVLLLEKSAFPRDQVCGDGLTPRAVKQLLAMGFDLDEPGWQTNTGLRLIAAAPSTALPRPDTTHTPPSSLPRARTAPDALQAARQPAAK